MLNPVAPPAAPHRLARLPLSLQPLARAVRAAPCFPLRSRHVRVMTSPGAFYAALEAACGAARRRLAVASLYLGTGRLERELLRRAADSLNARDHLTCNVLVDFQRGTRGICSSATLLQELLKGDPDRCKVSFYQSPVLLGLAGAVLPARYNELLGLQHMKLYVADDAVLLSGANCSNDYFTQRQDRYVEFQDPDLANFFAELIDEVSSFSRPCTPEGILPVAAGALGTQDRQAFVAHANDKINNFIQRWTERQHKKMEEADEGEFDTWVFPLIQMGQLGITQDENATREMLASAPQGSQLKLATGYFNLTRSYADTIVNKCAANVSLLMAHPNANGFLGAAGVAGGIPHAYSLIARKFWEQVLRYRQEHRVQLLEYERPGWTFHAKGLWYYPPGSSVPWMTLVGSANLGERSVRRDLEAQAAIFTTSPELQAKLHEECAQLHEHAAECSRALAQRPVPLWVRAAVGLFRHYF